MSSTPAHLVHPQPVEVAGMFYATHLSQIVCDTMVPIHGVMPITRKGTVFRLTIKGMFGTGILGLESHTLRALAKPDRGFWTAHVAFSFPRGRSQEMENLVRGAFQRWEHPLQILGRPGCHNMSRDEPFDDYTFRSSFMGSFDECRATCSIVDHRRSVIYEMVAEAGFVNR